MIQETLIENIPSRSLPDDNPQAVVDKQRSIQQPELPLPAQYLEKPGLEADMKMQPRFMAGGYKESGKLEGLTALVAGGDSGIGRAVAVLFAGEDADVAIFYLNEHADAEETKRCIEAEDRRCVLMAGDVKDAAFQEYADSLEDITEERFDETLQTNIYGYFHMAKAALLDYSATKGAIHAFTKSLARNLLDKGIRVNAMAPGPVWTPLNLADMKRPAQPVELSPAFVFLASPVCGQLHHRHCAAGDRQRGRLKAEKMALMKLHFPRGSRSLQRTQKPTKRFTSINYLSICATITV